MINKPSILIEQLIHFDKTELAIGKLIFSKYRLKWLLVLSFLFIFIGALLFAALESGIYVSMAILLPLMLLVLYAAVLYSKRKTSLILRMHSIKYKLEVRDVWRNRYFLIKEIQLRKLEVYLLQYATLNSDNIKLIIDSLRSENTLPRYQYQFFQIFSLLFSVIIGALLAAIIALPNMFTSWNKVIAFFKPIIGFSLLFVLFTWFVETMLLREIFRLSRNKYGRLIKTLENYHIRHYNN